jgi:hypothetical protein
MTYIAPATVLPSPVRLPKIKIGVRRHLGDYDFEARFESKPIVVLRERVELVYSALSRPLSRTDFETTQKDPFKWKRHWNNVTLGATYLARRVPRDLHEKPLRSALQACGMVALGLLVGVQGGILSVAVTTIRGEATRTFRSVSATLEDRVLFDIDYLGSCLGLSYERLRFGETTGRDLQDVVKDANNSLSQIEFSLNNRLTNERVRKSRSVRRRLQFAKKWGQKLALAVEEDIERPGRIKYRELVSDLARYV